MIRQMVLILILLTLCVMPTLAQETTESPPINTPIMVVPAPVVAAPLPTPDILSLTLGELIGIVVGLGALGVGLGKILWDANQNPGGASVDTRLTERVDIARNDREWIERLERAYALGGLQSKTAIDALTSVLTTIAPLTGLKADDALLRILKDVQQPGANVDVTVNTAPMEGGLSPIDSAQAPLVSLSSAG